MKLCIKKRSSDIKRPELTASEMGVERPDCFPSPGFAAYLALNSAAVTGAVWIPAIFVWSVWAPAAVYLAVASAASLV